MSSNDGDGVASQLPEERIRSLPGAPGAVGAGVALANASVAGSVVLFGLSTVATRVAVQSVSPILLSVLRFGAGGLLLALALAILAPNRLRVAGQDVPFLIMLGAIQFAAFSLTYNLGLQFTEASRGALMLATMPLWSAFLARWMGRERLRPSQVFGIIVTLGGVASTLAENTLTIARSEAALLGDGLMLLTAILGALYGVLAHRVLARYHAVTVTTYAMILGTLLSAPFCMLEHPARDLGRMGTTEILLVLFLATFGGAIAYFLWTFGFTMLAPTQVAIYVNLNPMVAMVMGAALLGESITPLFLVGFLAVLGGVFIVNWPRGSG